MSNRYSTLPPQQYDPSNPHARRFGTVQRDVRNGRVIPGEVNQAGQPMNGGDPATGAAMRSGAATGGGGANGAALRSGGIAASPAGAGLVSGAAPRFPRPPGMPAPSFTPNLDQLKAAQPKPTYPQGPSPAALAAATASITPEQRRADLALGAQYGGHPGGGKMLDVGGSDSGPSVFGGAAPGAVFSKYGMGHVSYPGAKVAALGPDVPNINGEAVSFPRPPGMPQGPFLPEGATPSTGDPVATLFPRPPSVQPVVDYMSGGTAVKSGLQKVANYIGRSIYGSGEEQPATPPPPPAPDQPAIDEERRRFEDARRMALRTAGR